MSPNWGFRQPSTYVVKKGKTPALGADSGDAYPNALPNAEMHRLNSGHFAVEDCLPFIVEKMMAFYEKTRTM